MTQQLAFQEPTTVDDLKPLDQFKHGEDFATITGYRIPSTGCFVMCRTDNGEFELSEDAVVEIAS